MDALKDRRGGPGCEEKYNILNSWGKSKGVLVTDFRSGMRY